MSRAARSAPPARDSAPACDLSLDEFVQWGHLATSTACHLWDWTSWDRLSAKHVELARASGGAGPLSIALSGRGVYPAWCGDYEASTRIIAEYDAVNEATRIGWFSACGLMHAAHRGRAEALAVIEASHADCVEREIGQVLSSPRG